jgi:hypothetical protein
VDGADAVLYKETVVKGPGAVTDGSFDCHGYQPPSSSQEIKGTIGIKSKCKRINRLSNLASVTDDTNVNSSPN